MTTLKVLFNFNSEETDANEYSAYTFVSTVMLLVINLFADDLKIPIEYFNKINFSPDVDIYVNFNDEDGVYDNSSVEMIWPHYQNRYCLIYSNTRKTTVDNLLSFTNSFIILSIIFWNVNWICIYLMLRYRIRKSFEESLGRALSYTSQSEMMLPIPTLKIGTAEKFYMASNFIQNFLKVTDQEIIARTGYSPEPITDFGIGEPCLYELKQGVYLRRGCFLACDVANKTVQKNEGIVFLNEEINFQQVFKISKGSKYFGTIKKLLRRYFEAGVLDRIFNNIHETSHKYLEETRYADQIKLRNLYAVSKEMLLFGFFGSIILLFCEIAYHRWYEKRSNKIRDRKRIRRVHFHP